MDKSHPTQPRAPQPPQTNESGKQTSAFYCPRCSRPVDDPLVCGDCSAVICRICGTPLESADELAFG